MDTNKSNQNESTPDNPTIQSLMESTSYNPDTPVFDTDSSSDNNNDSDDSDFDEEEEDFPDDEDDDDSVPARPRSDNKAEGEPPTAENSPDEFLHARVRITSGKYTGQIGRIRRIVNTGWIYIEGDDGVTRPVRWGYVQVLSEDEDGGGDQEGAESDGSNDGAGNVDDDMHDADNKGKSDQDDKAPKSNEQQSLIGAKIRITNTLHAGLEGTITEKRSGVYLKVDTLPGKILLLQDVEIVKLSNPDGNTDAEKYHGATILADGGVEGTVEKVILGEWYFTDNLEVKRAFKRKEFEVLRYADGTVPKGPRTDEREDVTPKQKRKRETRVTRQCVADERSSADNETPKRHKQNPVKSEESDLSVNDHESETPSSQQNETNPLLGVTVRINSGRAAGHEGKVTKICSRGWLEVEGLENIKVHSHMMSIVDDGNLDRKAIEDHYSSCSRQSTKMPRIVKLGEDTSGDEGSDAKIKWDQDENEGSEIQNEASSSDNDMLISRASRHKDTKNRRKKDNERFIDKLSSTDFTGARIGQEDSISAEKGRLSEAESMIRWGRKPAVSLAVPITPKLNGIHRGRRRTRIRGSSVPTLDPILIQPSSTYFAGKSEGDTKNSLKLLAPEGLRHLDPVTKIEVFNRRTGRIMRGDESISLSYLPAALMDHPEYEPIVPLQSATHIARTGRSGRNIRVTETVAPQCRVRASAVEGKDVLVIKGEYRGLSGTIDSAMPGGWYVVSHLFKHDKLDLDVIVNSDNLQLMPYKVNWSPANSDPEQGELPTSPIKTRIRLRAAKLRLDALNEEKEKVIQSRATSNDAVANDVHLIMLKTEITKVKEAIDKHQKDLEESAQSSIRRAAVSPNKLENNVEVVSRF